MSLVKPTEEEGMPTLVQHARRFRLFAPVQTRHRFLNCIGFTFSATDKLFRTGLRKRFDAARTSAVVNAVLTFSAIVIERKNRTAAT